MLLRKNQNIVPRGLHYARVRRDRQSPIENDAQKRPAPRKPAAIREKRVIHLYSPDTRNHSVSGMAHSVNFGARFFRADPVRPFLFAASLAPFASLDGKSELAIERQRGFQRDKRFFCANPPAERFI